MTDNSIPTSRPEADALKEIPEMQTVSPPGEKSLVAGEAAAEKGIVAPTPGESITSLATGTTYNMGPFKPTRPYEDLKASALTELRRLLDFRHPYVTYVHDAFEYRETFTSSLSVATVL